MIFSSHSSRMRILQLTFALVCSCSAGLLTTEKHRLVPFCFLIFPNHNDMLMSQNGLLASLLKVM